RARRFAPVQRRDRAGGAGTPRPARARSLRIARLADSADLARPGRLAACPPGRARPRGHPPVARLRASRRAGSHLHRACLVRSRPPARFPPPCRTAHFREGDIRLAGLMAITTTTSGLEGHGLDPEGRVYWNSTTSLLYTHALVRGEAALAEGG